MVNLADTRLSNAKVKAYDSGLVAVFVGGTSGLGETAARQFAASADRPKIYLLGRNETAAERTIGELSQINPGGTCNFLKVDASLLGNIDAVCEQIGQKEHHINLLVLSQGYLSLDWKRQGKYSVPLLPWISFYPSACQG
jgi:NAD(P)-dependent dehydrogenase (short-subunit alcohol dehydrogenase family)